MAITSRQFEQLSEMGISLWQSKKTHHIDEAEPVNYLPQSQEDLTKLTKKTLFSDILRCLNLSLGEVRIQSNYLDVGLFNWYFIKEDINNNLSQSNTSAKKILISYVDNKLVTPSIKTITQSPKLKQQLWQAIANNLL